VITFKDGPAHGVTLFLRRAPFLLRVTCGPDGKFDALDQLADTANEDETISVYYAEPKRMGFAFYDGKGGGWTSIIAGYLYLTPQPPDAVMRDNAKWVAWCSEYAKTDESKRRFVEWMKANE
jgi:hypothetical protein